MKKITGFILGFFVIVMGSCSNDSKNTEEAEEVMQPIARTQIPDTAFEQALIELGIDDIEDGSVVTSDLEMVTSLVMNDKGISNLTGISDFPMLENLWVNDNQISSLDVSKNTLLKFVFIENNGLTMLNVTNLTILEKISATNNNLMQLDISDNSLLQLLSVANNSLSGLDISEIPNSVQLNTFAVENNPLDCIRVNTEILNNIPPQWTKDEGDSYALECN